MSFNSYIAGKRCYFCGLWIHLLVTGNGELVDVFLVPGADADVRGLQRFKLDLRTGSTVYADSTFTHYPIEDLMREAGIELQPIWKKLQTPRTALGRLLAG